MKNFDKDKSEPTAFTDRDFDEFMSATGEAQWKILLGHAEKNKKIIQIRRRKTMEQYNDKRNEEIEKQFEEFCHTKGIAAKFKVAFANMAENARKQKAADKAQFEEVKRQSAENNPEFTEFLHTKGFKAKVRLVIENIKKGCKEAPHKTAVAADNISAQTKANIAHAQASVHNSAAGYGAKGPNETDERISDISAEDLSREFNEFLKAKGLDDKYVVEVSDGSGS